jgi:hypothetical protein
MTRDELLERITSEELTQWTAYCMLSEEERQWEKSLMALKNGQG